MDRGRRWISEKNVKQLTLGERMFEEEEESEKLKKNFFSLSLSF